MSEASHGCVQLIAGGGWDAAQEAPFLYAALKASTKERLDPCIACVSRLKTSHGCVQLTAEGG